MAEPGDALIEDDVEKSSESESDDDSDDSDESSTEEDESSSSESGSDSSGDSDEESSSDGESNVWESSAEEMETEEATEAGLQAEYTKALNLIIDGDINKALRKMKLILRHPLLLKHHVDLDLFDWEKARCAARENTMRVPSMARLYASLHFNISKLVSSPIGHLLQALTVFPIDEKLWQKVGESSMRICDWNTALFAFNKCPSSWNAVHGSIICLFRANLYSDCLEKLAEVLSARRHYVTGLVLKDAIRKSSPYWDEVCRRIFNENSIYLPDKDLSLVLTEKQKQAVLGEVMAIGEVQKPEAIERVLVVVDLSKCKSIRDVGVYICDTYDRIEWFGSFAMDTVRFIGEKPEDQDAPVVSGLISEMVDCICVMESIFDKLDEQLLAPSSFSSPKEGKRQRVKLNVALSRRSTRFHAEFNIDDDLDNAGNSHISTLLEEACALKNTVLPLSSLIPARIRHVSDEWEPPPPPDFEENDSLVQSCINSITCESQPESDIFEALYRYLSWIAEHCSREKLPSEIGEVLVESYRRWTSSLPGGGVSSSYPVELPPLRIVRIHVMAAEMGCEEAIFACHCFLEHHLPAELYLRMRWLLALNGESIFPSEVCRAHLQNIVDLLSEFPQSTYRSLIPGREVICLKYARSFIEHIDRRESVDAIHRLFEGKQFEKVVNIVENYFDWSESDRDVVEATALILIDSCLGVGDVEKASLWLCRLLNFTKGLRGTDKALEKLFLIDLDKLTLESISNIVHCIVPLLVDSYSSNVDLWLLLYEAARRLEGSPSAASLRALCVKGCLLFKSSLNILVAAHDAVAATVGCFVDNYRLPLFALREFARVRSESAITEIIEEGIFTDQIRAFQDEVHQCTFCIFGCPSRRKRQLEEHGGSHNYEPVEEDSESVLSLLLPDRLPRYDGSPAGDLVEVVQKKFASFLQPTTEETEMMHALDAFILEAKLGSCWPRCATSSSLRSDVFYHMAVNAYRSQRLEETVQFAKLFLVTSFSTADAEALFSAWTMLAFACASSLFSLSEEELILRLDIAIFPFRMALFFNGTDHHVTFNFGSALYQLRSKINRYMRGLPVEDTRYRLAKQRLEGLLVESAVHFASCSSVLPDGDPDKWECHYFLAKIAEKNGNSIEEVMDHYYIAARQLEASGVQYPLRINTKKQDNVEAIELHYRAYACIVKWLFECDEFRWTMDDLIMMRAFADCFQNHGVCRKEQNSTFYVGPQERAVLEKCIYECSVSENDDVSNCIYKIVERVSLRDELLNSCKDAFTVCIQRFPHFKSHYRLAELAIYEGNVKRAFDILFNSLLLKKKGNVSCDNIFENLIAVSRRDLDRGDAQQFHINRVAVLALDIARVLCDVNALVTLVHTLSTLYFCHNLDYLKKSDLVCMYRQTLNELSKCVMQKVNTGQADSTLLLTIFELYQYAGRNGEFKLCDRLSPLLVSIAKELNDFAPGSNPILFCKQLQAAAKSRMGKRRAKKLGLEPPNKISRQSSEDVQTAGIPPAI